MAAWSSSGLLILLLATSLEICAAFVQLPPALPPSAARHPSAPRRAAVGGGTAPIRRSVALRAAPMPDECCGDERDPGYRPLPTHGIDLPEWLDRLLALLFAIGGLIPLSIKADEAMQDGSKRIEALTNAESPSGVRMYMSKPEGVAKAPVVVVIHQFFGLREREQGLCEDLAARGYVGVAPDCYQGATTGFVPRAISLVLPAVVRGEWDAHLRAVDAAVEWAKSQEGADADKVYVCGFCFGGAVAARYAQAHPDKIRACGVFYGKPLEGGAEGMPPVYAVFGDKDSQFSPASIEAFKELLTQAGVRNEFNIYPGQGHAFVKDAAAIRAGGDAGSAWEGWLDFCSRA